MENKRILTALGGTMSVFPDWTSGQEIALSRNASHTLTADSFCTISANGDTTNVAVNDVTICNREYRYGSFFARKGDVVKNANNGNTLYVKIFPVIQGGVNRKIRGAQ